jgi:hypothetical protein
MQYPYWMMAAGAILVVVESPRGNACRGRQDSPCKTARTHFPGQPDSCAQYLATTGPPNL